jgi:hypothetical protein
VRLRLSGILYGVLVAGIVLLMDSRLYAGGGDEMDAEDGDDDVRRGDAAEALRIIEGARGHSLAAERLYDGLIGVLARHRAQQQ